MTSAWMPPRGHLTSAGTTTPRRASNASPISCKRWSRRAWRPRRVIAVSRRSRLNSWKNCARPASAMTNRSSNSDGPVHYRLRQPVDSHRESLAPFDGGHSMDRQPRFFDDGGRAVAAEIRSPRVFQAAGECDLPEVPEDRRGPHADHPGDGRHPHLVHQQDYEGGRWRRVHESLPDRPRHQAVPRDVPHDALPLQHHLPTGSDGEGTDRGRGAGPGWYSVPAPCLLVRNFHHPDGRNPQISASRAFLTVLLKSCTRVELEHGLRRFKSHLRRSR